MAKKAGDIVLGVGFQVDQSGLRQLEQSLRQLQDIKTVDYAKANNIDTTKAISELSKITIAAQTVETSLQKAFNPKLNSLNLTKFNKEISDAGYTMQEIYANFSRAGEVGNTAFRNLATQTLTANVQLKESNKILKNIGTTLFNSFKYTVSYGLINSFSNGINQAFQYSKALNSSLNDIRIVTDKSAQDMERFAESANKAARDLGKSTLDYTKASLIYYQQGLSDEEVAARTAVTLKTANVTGQSTSEVSEQLTAVWNGYKVSAQEAELYIDKLAAVAATTASDLEELSTGMSKVASAAASMGVDVDQLNAMLSTIVSVTRQAPESVGTSLRTILARMGDLKIDGEDEFGVTLGEVSSKLDEVGIKILETNGELREMGEVVEEIGNKWQTGAWSDAEKQAIAIELAGKRQYNALIALFDNWDMYQSSLNTSISAQGTLQKQQDIYMQSTAAHLEKMQTSWEGVKSALLKPSDINPVIDAVDKFAQILEKGAESIGGVKGLVLLLGSVFNEVFGTQIGKSIDGFVNNLNIAKQNANALQLEFKTLYAAKSANNGADEATNTLLNEVEKLQGQYKNLDVTLVNHHKQLIKEAENAKNLSDNYKELLNNAAKIANLRLGSNYTGDSLLAGNETALTALLDNNKLNISRLDSFSNNFKFAGGILGEDSFDYKQLTNVREAIRDLKEELNGLADADPKIKNLIQSIDTISKKGFLGQNLTGAEITKLKTEVQDLSNELQRMDQISEKTWNDVNTGKAREEINAYSRALEQVTLNSQRLGLVDTVASVTKMAGAFTQAGMSVKSFSNAVKEFKNGDFLGFWTSLSIGIGTTLTALKSFAETTDLLRIVEARTLAVKAAKEAKNAVEVKEIALSKLTEIGQKNAIKHAVSLIGVEKLLEATKNAENKEEVVRQLLQDKGLRKDKEIVTALLAMVGVEEADAAAKTKQKVASDLLNKSLLANPIFLVATAIAASIGAVAAYVNHLKKVNQELAENKLQENEKIKAQLEENKTLQDLTASYKELLEQYNKTGEGNKELQQKALELCDKYDLESAKVLALTGKYEQLNKVIDNYAASGLNNANKLVNNAQQAGEATMASNLDWGNALNNRLSSDLQNTLILHGGANVNLFSKDKEAISLLQNEFNVGYNTLFNQIGKKYDNILQAYEEMAKMLKVLSSHDLVDSDIYRDLKSQYEGLAQAASDYKDGVTAQNQILLQQTENTHSLKKFGDDLVYNKDRYIEFTKQVADFRTSLEEKFDKEGIHRTTEEIDELVEDHLKSINGVYAARMQALEALQLLNKGNTSSGISNGIKVENDTIKGFNIDKLLELDDKEFSFILSLGFTGKEDEQWIKKSLELLEEDKTPTITLEYTAGLIEGITDNKLSKTEAKEYRQNLAGATQENPIAFAGFEDYGKGEQLKIAQQAQNEAIQQRVGLLQQQLDVENNIKRLKDEQQLIDEGTLKNAQEARDAALQHILIRDKENNKSYTALQLEKELEEDRATLKENYSEDLEKDIEHKEKLLSLAKEENKELDAAEEALARASAASQDVKDRLEEASNIEFSNIQQEAFDLINQSIDTTIKKIDNLTTAAQLIGEGFKVAANDVDKLAEAYPELFENSSVVAEDMIQLNQQVVQEFVEGKKQEIKAEIKSQLERLGIQKDLLLAEKSFNDDRINILKDYLNSTKTAEQTKERLAKNTADYKKEVDDICTKAGIENVTQGVNVQADGSQTVLSNIRVLYSAYQQLSAVAAAALAGEKVGNMSLETGFISDAQIREWQDKGERFREAGQDDDGFYQEALQQIQELAARNKEIDGELSEIDAETAKLNARLTETMGTLGRVGSGKAGKKKSGGSSAQPDKKDLLKEREELDLYHDINLALAEIEHELKMLQKAEDKAFGKDYLANLNSQIKLLEKQKKLYKDKLALAKQDAAARQGALRAAGLEFDAQGYMTNYIQIMQAKLAYVNQLITAYNTMTAEEQKKQKQTIEDAKKDYEDLKKQIDEYDKLISNTIPQLEESIEDALNEQIELQIKAFNYEVDVRLDMAQATRDWNDFYKKVILDIEGIADPVKKIITGAKASLADFETYFNGRDGLGSIQYLTQHVREIMKEVNTLNAGGWSDVYGDNRAAAVEDLKKYNDLLMDNLENVQDIINDIRKSYLEGIDAAKDKLDEHKKQYDYIADLIQHDMNMVEMLGGPEDYTALEKYYEQAHSNNLKNLEFLRMQKEALKAQLDSVEKGSEAWKKLYEQYQSNLKDLNSALEESLKNIIDKYANTIKKVFDAMNKDVTGGLGLDYMQSSYDRQQDNANNYLDEVNRLYAIANIRDKYKDALNSIDDLNAQRKLNEVMQQQLKYLEEKDKLSQYEVERAEKILDLTLKQIALQEAQANKSQLRLRRDSQGNYTYQYTSDQDAINDAQNEVNKAMNDLYNFDLGNYRDILSQATQLTQEYEELVTQILTNAALSEEERTNRLAEVKQWYYAEMGALEEQLAINKVNLEESANMALEELYNQNKETFLGIVMDELVPGWNEALDNMVTNFTEDFIPRCEDAMNELNETTQEYEREIDELQRTADVDFALIQAGIDATIAETQALMQANIEVINTYNQEMQAIQGVINTLNDLIAKYQHAAAEAKAATQAAYELWQATQLTGAGVGGSGSGGVYGAASGSVLGTAGQGGSGGGSGSGGSGGSTKQTQTWYCGQDKDTGYKTSWYPSYDQLVSSAKSQGYVITGFAYTTTEGDGVTIKVYYMKRNEYDKNGFKLNPGYYNSNGTIKYYDPSRYATGGYTGSWGSEGKLAILDEKELVLNKDDTKNILSVVDIVRSLVSSVGSRVAAIGASIGIGPSPVQGGTAAALEQSVHIEANFPGVTSHSEIEQAFENLVNMASQHAFNTDK